ncbi:synaptotagmin-like protein 1 [Chanos chanos]|uniref:Synaptotagmin-like protein 1 n=1 Tax=Chanos chanos TaxID=29144 RepID=A0A6J2WM73_CHACN|nr:synaptotagmin-like protein 1 [Chanos chanos]
MMEGQSLLDLGHLTETEQEAILKVLLRDAELRSKEEKRLRKIQQTAVDPKHFRSLSGAWFREERAKRHQKGGVDIVHASLRLKGRDKDLPLEGVFQRQGKQKNLLPEEDCKEEEEVVVEQETGEEEEEKTGEEQRGESPEVQVSPVPRPRTRKPQPQEVTKDKTPQFIDIEDNRLLHPYSSLQVQGDVSDSDTDFSRNDLNQNKLGSIISLRSNNTFSGSMMSLFSVGDYGGVVVTGQIQFALQYDTKKEELHVRVVRCQDLAPARKNRSDPYVKVYLLPDNTSRSKRKTSVKKKTLNPVYDETLRYKVRRPDLKARVLSVSVWHQERVKRNVFLGEVEVPLSRWDWGQSQPTWHNLQPRVQISSDAISSRGTILMSLKFIPPGSEGDGLPVTGELHIWLREAVGLLPTKRGAPNTFIKSVVLPDEGGFSGQQTRMIRGTVSPLFNHTMVYDGLHASDLPQACAEVTVWATHTHSTYCLGGVRLSTGTGTSYGQDVDWMDSTEEETSVWKTVIKNPNTWVDTALPIRTNLQARHE